MPQADPMELARAAEEWAAAAAEIALAGLGRASVRKKADGSEVTDADEGIQRMLTEAIHRRFPSHGLIAEEATPTPAGMPRPSDARYCWVIDPLDGTRNYVRGYPVFATSLAVLDAGQPIVGVTRWHHTGQVFSGGRGLGARLNGQAMRVSHVPMDGSTLVGAQLGPSHRTEAVVAPWLGRWSVRNMGATSLHLALVAAGALGAAYAKDCSIWDLAAGALMIAEAGGVCTGADGSAIFPVDVAACATTNYPFIAGGPAAYDALLNDVQSRKFHAPEPLV